MLLQSSDDISDPKQRLGKRGKHNPVENELAAPERGEHLEPCCRGMLRAREDRLAHPLKQVFEESFFLF